MAVILFLITLLFVVFNNFTTASNDISENLFTDKAVQADTYNQVYEFQGDAYTKDTQIINELRLRLIYNYDSEMLPVLIGETGLENVEARYIAPIVQKTAKDIFGSVTAEYLIQNRGAVQLTIEDELISQLAQYGIIVISLAIEALVFDPVFEQAMQDRVIAEQNRLREEQEQIFR
ncbi:MAG: hypothetical protein LBC86_02000 [Oscillospiraceae bacterium]|jgi:regulator of protease activity HflC (stomatin/prohibitin superfamily)|nr:hypothetical protein [Oscillospiraceae bacterium]